MRQLVHFRYRLLLIFLFLLLSVFRESSTTTTTDTLSWTGSLSDGQTLISSNKTFELGFFSPNGSSNRYVGIWYYDYSDKTPVWVANRNDPLLDTSGVLHFDNNGELVIVDGSTGSFFVVAYVFSRKAVEATILNSGNLVIREVNNVSSILWQSFDYPTDTWLPGMKLGVVEGKNRLITAWSSLSDPASGDFSFGLDPNRKSQCFIWQKGIVYWSTGMWNGTQFQDVPEWAGGVYINPSFDSNSDGAYFTYNRIIDKYPVPTKVVIQNNGQFQLLTWVRSVAQWVLIWAQPYANCDVYNICGAFGLCKYMVRSIPTVCTCLQGFAPASQSDWNNGDTSGGCARQSKLQCATGRMDITFVATPLLYLPPNSKEVNARGIENCEAVCLSECNCTGYAFAKLVCHVWYGDLINMQLWPNFTENVLYVRENASIILSSGKHSQGDKTKTDIIASVSAMIFLLLCIGLILIRKWIRHQGKRKYHNNNQLELELGISGEVTLWESHEKNIQVALYGFSCISEATSNFSEENKLGEGGFGPVYKGRFSGGQEVAVKRLAATSGQGLIEFKNEILLIARLQHRNLVRLLGCCVKDDEKMLIYEYLQNKSLDFFIFDKVRGELLDWGKRFQIVEGIARGLLYLHKHSRLRIIHRDLKASNILLDEEMNPKISDFGMARMFCSNETQGSTRRIVGTYGYMAPEYAFEGIFSTKSDVFSFGVLLLEIVSGLRNSGFRQHGNSLSLLGYAWDLWKEERWFQMVDRSFINSCPMKEVRRCIHVALMCVQECAADRPSMSEVLTMLDSVDNLNLPDPKQPAFFTVRVNAVAGNSSRLDPNKSSSVNMMTNSIPEGR